MRKLADLYFNYDVKSGDYKVAATANIKKEEEKLVEDLIRDSRVKVKLNNACKNIQSMMRGDKDVEVAKFEVNLNSTVSTASNIKLVVTLLKQEDESDMLVSLFSLVAGPTM